MNSLHWRITVVLILAGVMGLQAAQKNNLSPAKPPATSAESWSALESSMDRMHAAMHAIQSSGDADADFVQLMLPHHQAAIDMAKAQLLYGKDEQIKRLAQEILTDQQSEVALMQLWLQQHPSSATPNAQQ